MRPPRLAFVSRAEYDDARWMKEYEQLFLNRDPLNPLGFPDWPLQRPR